MVPAIFAELHRIALAVDHLELFAIQVGRIAPELGQNVLAQDGARHVPGRVQHDGADLAGEDGGGPLLLADDDPTGEDLAARLHHAQAVVRNVDQHIATGKVIHQITAPQVAYQQAGAHLGAGIEPAAGLTADDAVGGQAVAALELLDGLFGLGIVEAVLVSRGTVPSSFRMERIWPSSVELSPPSGSAWRGWASAWPWAWPAACALLRARRRIPPPVA